MSTVIDRVRLLIEHLEAKNLSQEEIAAAFGRSQGWTSQVKAGLIKEVKSEVTRTAIAKLRIAPTFFTGSGPVTDYLGDRVELDAGVTALEEYVAERASADRPVREKVVERARASARSTGMATRTEAAALVDFLEGVIAREERGEPAPAADPRNVIDDARGQVEAPPERFKKRTR